RRFRDAETDAEGEREVLCRGGAEWGNDSVAPSTGFTRSRGDAEKTKLSSASPRLRVTVVQFAPHDRSPHRRHVRAVPALLRHPAVPQRRSAVRGGGGRAWDGRADDRGWGDAYRRSHRSCDRVVSQRSVAG